MATFLADVDVAPLEFERRVGAHAFHVLDRVLEIEERGDFDDAANAHHQKAEHEQDGRVGFDNLVFVDKGHVSSLPYSAGAAATVAAALGSPRVTVSQRLTVMISAPER